MNKRVENGTETSVRNASVRHRTVMENMREGGRERQRTKVLYKCHT